MAATVENALIGLCQNTTCNSLHPSLVNETAEEETPVSSLDAKDASWIMTSALIIFTMQTGFGLLESGSVSSKSETNIMIKNALDVVFGGITYWAFGFGFSFGVDKGSNPFIGFGNFFGTTGESDVGYTYAVFLFQFSFATTATTIVSGAMAERTKLLAYTCFSMLMTVIYTIPAHWVWADQGFLYQLGAIDVAGCGPVHMVGGVTGLVATLMIGSRSGAFDSKRGPPPAPMKVILGMFMLWWSWLRFNAGSVFVVSKKAEWKRAVRAAVNTIVASMGGGITSVVISVVRGKMSKNCDYDIGLIVNGILGSLVSITAICTMCEPWEAFLIGCIGVIFSIITDHLVYLAKIDDPVGVIPVHFICGVWGLLSVGIFADNPVEGRGGLIRTGETYLLGIQALTALIIIVWTAIMAMIFLKTIDLIIGLRLSKTQEEIGADYIEHGIRSFFSIASSEFESRASEDEAQHGSSQLIQSVYEMLQTTTETNMAVHLSNPAPDVVHIELRVRKPKKKHIIESIRL